MWVGFHADWVLICPSPIMTLALQQSKTMQLCLTLHCAWMALLLMAAGLCRRRGGSSRVGGGGCSKGVCCSVPTQGGLVTENTQPRVTAALPQQVFVLDTAPAGRFRSVCISFGGLCWLRCICAAAAGCLTAAVSCTCLCCSRLRVRSARLVVCGLIA